MKHLPTLLIIFTFTYKICASDFHQHNTDSNPPILEKTIEKNRVIEFFYPLIKDFKKIGLAVKYLLSALQLVNKIVFFLNKFS